MRAGHRSGRRRHALAAELPALTTRGRWCGCERCRETSTTTTEPQSSTLSLRHSTPASRSFVLAALRALHLDPAAPRNARPHTRRPRTLPHNNRIPRLTRPHSFRHAVHVVRRGVRLFCCLESLDVRGACALPSDAVFLVAPTRSETEHRHKCHHECRRLDDTHSSCCSHRAVTPGPWSLAHASWCPDDAA